MNNQYRTGWTWLGRAKVSHETTAPHQSQIKIILLKRPITRDYPQSSYHSLLSRSMYRRNTPCADVRWRAARKYRLETLFDLRV